MKCRVELNEQNRSSQQPVVGAGTGKAPKVQSSPSQGASEQQIGHLSWLKGSEVPRLQCPMVLGFCDPQVPVQVRVIFRKGKTSSRQ